MEKTDVNTALAIFFVAFAVVFIAGLVVIPALQEAEAANTISEQRNKGKWGAIQGNGGGGGVCPQCEPA
jgi:SNF family Na+-dependent transporter